MPTFMKGLVLAVAIAGLAVPTTGAQSLPQQALDLPPQTKSLEGQPRVAVETSPTAATRRVLAAGDALAERLVIRVERNRYFWGSDPRPLTVQKAGEFIYLSSAEPGKYIRLQKINDKLSYVAHLDQGARSITYWGELRVVIGR